MGNKVAQNVSLTSKFVLYAKQCSFICSINSNCEFFDDVIDEILDIKTHKIPYFQQICFCRRLDVGNKQLQ